MGYYSEVALALTKVGVSELKAKLADRTLPAKDKEETRQLLDHADRHFVDDEAGSEIWYWESLKWYDCDPDNFPEVDFIEKLMEQLDPDDYRFMRVGEESHDTEERGNFWDNPFDLSVCRYISLAAAV